MDSVRWVIFDLGGIFVPERPTRSLPKWHERRNRCAPVARIRGPLPQRSHPRHITLLQLYGRLARDLGLRPRRNACSAFICPPIASWLAALPGDDRPRARDPAAADWPV